MSIDDRSYFRERAEAEIAAAQRAEHPRACSAHYVLAGFYLDLAYNEAASPDLPHEAAHAVNVVR